MSATCCTGTCRRKVHRHGLCSLCLSSLETSYGIVLFLALPVDIVAKVANAMGVPPHMIIYGPMKGGPDDRLEPKPGARRLKPRRGLWHLWAEGSSHWLCHLTPIDGPSGRPPRSLCGNLPRVSKLYARLFLPAGRRVCLSCLRRAKKHWKKKGSRWVPK